MRILTLWQPWATLIAMQLKKYETRSWGTSYRGALAIHASKRPVKQDEILAILYSFGDVMPPEQHDALENACKGELPLGCIVAAANLTDCLEMDWKFGEQAVAPGKINVSSVAWLERAVGNWDKGRFAWKLDAIQQIAPIYCRGGQGLRHIDPVVKIEIEAQLNGQTASH